MQWRAPVTGERSKDTPAVLALNQVTRRSSPQVFTAIETWVSTFANAVRIAAEQAAVSRNASRHFVRSGRAQRAYVSLDALDLLTRSERAMASRAFDTASSPPMRPVPVPRVR